jgi:hypothetical protein
MSNGNRRNGGNAVDNRSITKQLGAPKGKAPGNSGTPTMNTWNHANVPKGPPPSTPFNPFSSKPTTTRTASSGVNLANLGEVKPL